jgi:hypothetical protein
MPAKPMRAAHFLFSQIPNSSAGGWRKLAKISDTTHE